MPETVKRKCKKCNQSMEIKKDDVRGVICFKNFYYHTSCFCELARNKSQSTDKRVKTEDWQNALDNIVKLEAETRKILQKHWGDKEARDALNEYLLDTYDVIAITDSRFWQTVADLSNGEYKKKRCKKVSTQTLLDTWQWMQHKLNDINRYNKANHKGPQSDRERIPYDLAIVVKGIPEYLEYKAAHTVTQVVPQTKVTKINYNKMQRTEVKCEGLGDISDLLDLI